MNQHPICDLTAAPAAGVPQHQVRAHFTAESVTIYQAFSLEIGARAVRAQKFVYPFRRNRMTWLKPSFAWMMYRSGWGTKVGQECVLRIEVARPGFDWALSHSCLTTLSNIQHIDHDSWKRSLEKCPVRIQWDPERTLLLEPLPWRTIQIGVGRAAVDMYVDQWMLGIEDITETVRAVNQAVQARDFRTVNKLVLVENPYPLADRIARQIDSTEANNEGVRPVLM